MAFSSIKIKPCKCGCGKPKAMGYNGYAGKSHMPEDMQMLPRYQKGAVASNKAQGLAKNSRSIHDYQDDVTDPQIALKRADLEQWFDNIARQIRNSPFCWECKAYISERYYRHATAHIFPKAIFESVATHPMNYLILGAACGCHDKTHRLDTFSDMKVFGEACRRFKLFEKSITEKHKYLNTFKQYVDGTI